MGRKLLLLGLALATLVGCAGENPLDLIASANAITTEVGTAKMSLKTSIRGLGDGLDFTTNGEGVIDFANQRGRITQELPDFGAESLGDLEFIYDGTVIYYNAAGLFSDSPTPWLSFDLATASEEMTGTDFEQLQQSGSSDPSNSLALLEGVAEEIEEVGTEEIRGVETTHYRTTVDVRRAIESRDAVTDPEKFQMFLDQFGAETIPLEVWLDDEGRAVRTRYDQPFPESTDVPFPADASTTITIEFFDFGVDAPVEIPPANEVTDITDIASDLAEGG